MGKIDNFRKELTDLINKYSMENESNTADYVISGYLIECLNVYNQTMQSRQKSFMLPIDNTNLGVEE